MKKLITFLPFTFLVVSLFAQVPKTMSFQGYLTDNAGEPINNPTPGLLMTFALFDSNTGGVKVWGEETHTGVPINKGLFNVILGGAGSPIDLPFNTTYYLEIKINAETLPSRITMTSGGYSLSGLNASNISSGSIADARLSANLQDLADGSLTGSLIGAGVNANNITNGILAVANGGTAASTAVAARSNLGLIIGTNVQAYDTDLDDLADGSLTGSKVGTGINAANVTINSVAVGNGGTGATNATTARTNLGLAIGTNVQAYDADLDDLADGMLSGTKVGTGINAANITSGILDAPSYIIAGNGLRVGANSNPGANNLMVDGFTGLGIAAPLVQMKKLTGTTSGSADGTVGVNHGLAASKILNVSVMVEYTTGNFIGPNFLFVAGHCFNWYLTPTQIVISNVDVEISNPASGGDDITSTNIRGKAFKILVTYEQ